MVSNVMLNDPDDANWHQYAVNELIGKNVRIVLPQLLTAHIFFF